MGLLLNSVKKKMGSFFFIRQITAAKSFDSNCVSSWALFICCGHGLVRMRPLRPSVGRVLAGWGDVVDFCGLFFSFSFFVCVCVFSVFCLWFCIALYLLFSCTWNL